jgi:hypothetical protein
MLCDRARERFGDDGFKVPICAPCDIVSRGVIVINCATFDATPAPLFCGYCRMCRSKANADYENGSLRYANGRDMSKTGGGLLETWAPGW